MMKDWLDASLFYVSNEPGFRVNTNPRRTYTISLSSSMMYIRQMQILVQAQICTWLIVYTKKWMQEKLSHIHLLISHLSLRSSRYKCFTSSISFIFSEVLNESCSKILSFFFPFRSISICVTRIKDS